jgi:hypothetical protein
MRPAGGDINDAEWLRNIEITSGEGIEAIGEGLRLVLDL